MGILQLVSLIDFVFSDALQSCQSRWQVMQHTSVITAQFITEQKSPRLSVLINNQNDRTVMVPFIIYTLTDRQTNTHRLTHMHRLQTHTNTLITHRSDNDNREPGRLNSSSAFS